MKRKVTQIHIAPLPEPGAERSPSTDSSARHEMTPAPSSGNPSKGAGHCSDVDANFDVELGEEIDADLDLDIQIEIDPMFLISRAPADEAEETPNDDSPDEGVELILFGEQPAHHRRFPRVAIDKEVRFRPRAGGNTTAAKLSDMSVGGLFICTDSAPPPGTAILCDFVLDDMANHDADAVSIHATGKVVWLSCGDERKRRGFGMEFCDIAPADRNAIARAIDITRVVEDLDVVGEKPPAREAVIPGGWADNSMVRVEDSIGTDDASDDELGSSPPPAIDVTALPPLTCLGPDSMDGEDTGSDVVSGEIVAERELPPASAGVTEDKREHKRIIIRQPIRFITNQGCSPHTAEIANISAGGLFVLADFPPPPETEIAFGFFLEQADDGSRSMPIIARGRIVWTSHGMDESSYRGFGLKFTRITAAHRAKISRFIRSKMEQSSSEGGTAEARQAAEAEWCVDERRYARVALQKPVSFCCQNTAFVFEASLSDLSVGGMFIRTELTIEPGTIVDCDLVLDPMRTGNQRNIVHVRGVIIWNSTTAEGGKGPGFGVKFLEISSSHLRKIASLVHRNQENRVATLLGW
jgi:c-di-GMP-binding flagellar brake protein YcgR